MSKATPPTPSPGPAAGGTPPVRLRVLGPWPGWEPARVGRLDRGDGSGSDVLLVPAGDVLHTPESAGLDALREEARRVARVREPGLLRLKQVAEVDGAALVVFEAAPELRPLAGLVRTAPTAGPRAAVPLRASLELVSSVAVTAGVALGAGLDPAPALVPGRVLLDADGHPRLVGVHGVPGAAPAVSFALGGLLLACLLGETPPTTPAQARRGLIRLLSSSTPRPPDAVVDLLRAALAEEPAERPAPGGLGAALGALGRGQPSDSLRDWQARRRAPPAEARDGPRLPRALGLATGPLPDMLGEPPPTEPADDGPSAGVDEVPLGGATEPPPRRRRPEGTRPMDPPVGREGGTVPLVDEATAEDTEEVERPTPGAAAAGAAEEPERTVSTPGPGTKTPVAGSPPRQAAAPSPALLSPAPPSPALLSPAPLSPAREHAPLGPVVLAGPAADLGGGGADTSPALDLDDDLELRGGGLRGGGGRGLILAAVALLALGGGWWALGTPGLPSAGTGASDPLRPADSPGAPVVEEAVAEEPPAEAPAVAEAVAEAPAAEGPPAEEPAAEAPPAEEPAAEAPPAEEPAAEAPPAEEPAAGPPAEPAAVVSSGGSAREAPSEELEPRIQPRIAPEGQPAGTSASASPDPAPARDPGPSQDAASPTRAVISVPVSTEPAQQAGASGAAEPATPSHSPAATAPSAAAATSTRSAAPADPAPWRLVFVVGDSRVERIEVTCHGGRTGAGTDRVTIPDAVPGPCRVEARSEALGRLVAHVSVAGTAEYECFVGGSRSCR